MLRVDDAAVKRSALAASARCIVACDSSKFGQTAFARIAGLDRQASPAEAEYRATMVVTQMLGLGLTRLVLGLPAAAGASVDELAATVGPSVERYLSGDIDLPARLA